MQPAERDQRKRGPATTESLHQITRRARYVERLAAQAIYSRLFNCQTWNRGQSQGQGLAFHSQCGLLIYTAKITESEKSEAEKMQEYLRFRIPANKKNK